MLFGELTFSQNIFWLNNEYFVNSIKCVDWEGKAKTKVPTFHMLKRRGFEKYFKTNRKFVILDIFNKDGQFIASAEINKKIVFLDFDNKNRVLGLKEDGENIPTIVRYKVWMR